MNENANANDATIAETRSAWQGLDRRRNTSKISPGQWKSIGVLCGFILIAVWSAVWLTPKQQPQPQSWTPATFRASLELEFHGQRMPIGLDVNQGLKESKDDAIARSRDFLESAYAKFPPEN